MQRPLSRVTGIIGVQSVYTIELLCVYHRAVVCIPESCCVYTRELLCVYQRAVVCCVPGPSWAVYPQYGCRSYRRSTAWHRDGTVSIVSVGMWTVYSTAIPFTVSACTGIQDGIYQLLISVKDFEQF